MIKLYYSLINKLKTLNSNEIVEFEVLNPDCTGKDYIFLTATSIF